MKTNRRSFVGAAAAAAAVWIAPQREAAAQSVTWRLRPGGDDRGFDPWVEIIGDHFRHNARRYHASREDGPSWPWSRTTPMASAM